MSKFGECNYEMQASALYSFAEYSCVTDKYDRGETRDEHAEAGIREKVGDLIINGCNDRYE